MDLDLCRLKEEQVVLESEIAQFTSIKEAKKGPTEHHEDVSSEAAASMISEDIPSFSVVDAKEHVFSQDN